MSQDLTAMQVAAKAVELNVWTPETAQEFITLAKKGEVDVKWWELQLGLVEADESQ